MFLITKIDLGEIRVGSKNRFNFSYDNVDYISRVTSPCVCTDVNNDAKNKVITSTYVPKEIPVHLKIEGITKQPVSYTIVVEYMKDGHTITQELTFTAIVTE